MRLGPLSPAWWPVSPPVVRPHLIAPPEPRACPLVPLVGACCAGCAEGGKTCSGAKEVERSVALVGAFGGEKALPWSDVEAFNATATLFDADVRNKGTEGMKMLWLAVLIGWWPRWRAWFDATKNEWSNLGFVAGKKLESFESFRKDYNVLVDQFTQAGLQTSQKPVDTSDKSPLQEGIEKGAEAAGEGAGAFGAALGSSLGTLAWVAAAGAALYFLGPTLIASFFARRARAA